jgi:hypothetical protein
MNEYVRVQTKKNEKNTSTKEQEQPNQAERSSATERDLFLVSFLDGCAGRGSLAHGNRQTRIARRHRTKSAPTKRHNSQFISFRPPAIKVRIPPTLDTGPPRRRCAGRGCAGLLPAVRIANCAVRQGRAPGTTAGAVRRLPGHRRAGRVGPLRPCGSTPRTARARRPAWWGCFCLAVFRVGGREVDGSTLGGPGQ